MECIGQEGHMVYLLFSHLITWSLQHVWHQYVSSCINSSSIVSVLMQDHFHLHPLVNG